MDPKSLVLFVEAARAGGFASAARGLGQDPSAVSRAVAQLEEELGVRLFQRTTRKVSLTEAGARFLARVEPVLAELEAAREEARADAAQPRGRLALSASIAFGQVCVTPHIPEFLERFPEIDLELNFTDRPVDLIGERIDLAIRLVAEVSVNAIASKLVRTRYRVCASPEYLAAQGAPAAPEDLSDRRCVCFDLPEYRSLWRFRDAAGAESAAPIAPRLTISGGLAVREACRLGLGPALLADWLARADLESGRLIDLFPAHQATATSFDTAAWILYPSRSFLPLKTRVMIDFLREKLAG